jgi:hypothetical protein
VTPTELISQASNPETARELNKRVKLAFAELAKNYSPLTRYNSLRSEASPRSPPPPDPEEERWIRVYERLTLDEHMELAKALKALRDGDACLEDLPAEQQELLKKVDRMATEEATKSEKTTP